MCTALSYPLSSIMQAIHQRGIASISCIPCSPEEFLTACSTPAVANVLERLADEDSLPPAQASDLQSSIKHTVAAMFTICTRATIARHELTTHTMYALIWILRSIDSQWFSWANHTVTEFLEAAEQHPRRPAPPQDHKQCLQGMRRMQVQLLQRCKWHMALEWHRDVSPAVHLLATCSARSIFHWLCNLCQSHLAPITPAPSEAAKAAIPRSTPAHQQSISPSASCTSRGPRQYTMPCT